MKKFESQQKILTKHPNEQSCSGDGDPHGEEDAFYSVGCVKESPSKSADQV